MPYETKAKDRPEMFGAGALTWPAEGVVLRDMHNRAEPIIRFMPKDEGGQVRVTIPLPDTQRGRDAAVGVRNGTYTGLSVEFRSLVETRRAGLRYITSAFLEGAGLVDNPSYMGATIEVRGIVRRFPIWL